VREFLSPEPLEADSPSKIKEVPVLYGGDFGPDISFVANQNAACELPVVGKKYAAYKCHEESVAVFVWFGKDFSGKSISF
jgi:hypothetical protein